MSKNSGLKKPSRMDGYLGAKTTQPHEDKVKAFCEFRNWNLSAFIRRAIDESMEKVVKEEGK